MSDHTDNLIPCAIAYDFDGTLSPGNMQEHDFIPAIGMQPGEFWALANDRARASNGDPILAYLNLMIERARAANQPVRREDFVGFGKTVKFFPGVEGWFDRLNGLAADRGIRLSHVVISSGIREMIQGTRIADQFDQIFASAFMYDANGVAVWPALAINYTTKTQYLFRINKGTPEVWDNSRINRYIPQADRPVPFTNMVFIGDGTTDVPCMRLVKEQGGHSIAVYDPALEPGSTSPQANVGALGARGAAESLLADGRVNFIAPADYQSGQRLEQQLVAVFDWLKSRQQIARLSDLRG